MQAVAAGSYLGAIPVEVVAAAQHRLEGHIPGNFKAASAIAVASLASDLDNS